MPECGIEKICRNVVSFLHNPKELQYQFYLGESFRAHIRGVKQFLSKIVPFMR